MDTSKKMIGRSADDEPSVLNGKPPKRGKSQPPRTAGVDKQTRRRTGLKLRASK